MPSSLPTRSPSLWAYVTTSSISMLAMGTKGQTSVAPIRGCSPECLLMSMSSDAFLMAKKAASITSSGVPTKVTTVLLVAFPGSTLSSFTPSTLSISSVICLITSILQPSEKLGTHSISCLMAFNFIWLR